MSLTARVVFLLLACSFVAACNCGEDAPLDAGVTDSGIGGAGDAGPVDAGTRPADAGTTDAGTTDAGTTDAGVTDAGMTDAGMTDAGTADSGTADAGTQDAGVQSDDAGCPLPTGFVADAGGAGLPAGLVLWLRGDISVATLDGGAVCRWEDVSGNGRHFAPSSTTLPRLEPARVNGRAAVVFSTRSWLERPDVLGLAPRQGRTIAVRSQIPDTTRRFGSFLQGNRANNWEYLELEQNTFNTVGGRVGVYLTANAYDSDLPTSAAARTHVYAIATLDAGTVLPGALFYAVDGVQRTLTRTPGGNGPMGPGNNLIWDFSSAGFTSIGETTAQGFTGGAIGEVLVFDHPLTASERSAVEAHLGR